MSSVLDTSAGRQPRLATGTSRVRLGLTDLAEGFRQYPVWSTFGWQDIRQRYRRSVLGPLWITLTMAVTIAGMGPLYAELLKIDASDFIPWLALGLIAWGIISGVILEGCTTFSGADNMIRSVRMPLSLHAFRMIYRNLLIFCHNIFAYLPFALYLGITPTWLWLMALPGLLLILIAAFPVSLILGILCARFRDLQQIVASIVQLAFFLTPILWKPELLGPRQFIANYNPLFIFIDLLRGPVYGYLPGLKTYVGAAVIIVVLYAIAIPLFIRFRQRIAFWV